MEMQQVNVTVNVESTVALDGMLTSIVNMQFEKKQKKDIWENSPWTHIAELENDYVGKVGEQFLQQICDAAGIDASIDGTKTKEIGGGMGDGVINGRSVEIKTARAGTGSTISFQHELGEKPWIAEFMAFIDIAPDKFYLSIFPNFSEEQYKSGCKCEPFFPTRSVCWRKKQGAFKLDTTESLNATQSTVENPHTFSWTPKTSFAEVGDFIRRVIQQKVDINDVNDIAPTPPSLTGPQIAD
jgi:hypothetical protein